MNYNVKQIIPIQIHVNIACLQVSELESESYHNQNFYSINELYWFRRNLYIVHHYSMLTIPTSSIFSQWFFLHCSSNATNSFSILGPPQPESPSLYPDVLELF